jgi:uncharacterized protein (TIGR00661 family)
MRILYGVTGCGLGHTMRARALAQHLEARGHVVKLAASGRAVEILERHGLDVVRIDGMSMRFAEGEAKLGRTLLDLLRRAPLAIARNAEVAWEHVLDFDPEVLVTDFDTFTSAVGALLGRPVISVDHQHVVDRFRHPRAVKDAMSSYRMARAVVTAKTPRCSHYVVTSFFFPPPRWGSTTLVGPVVRREVAAAIPTRGEHVLVYQTTSGDSRLVPALAAVPGVKFVLYGLGREETIGNVELRAFDEARFVRDLASSRAVIANGGFTTLSEAVVLGKPVLSIPVRRQPEQELNAAWLEVLGLGMRADSIEPGVVRRFLDRVDSFGCVQDPRIRTGTDDATAALDRALREAA